MHYKKIKIIFIGTPDFAIPSLHALIENNRFDILAVITQPDKKVGRKQTLTPPPVKAEALRRNIKIWQPNQISNFQFPISNIDIIIVVAYAQILPESILGIPRYGCINIHASLLPKYRGASPIQAAIINGDEKTGITIIKMDKGVDTGPILAQEPLKILPDDSYGTLYKKLAELGAQILTLTLKKYINGEITPRAQDNSKASYTGAIKKSDGKINWSKSAEELERFVRAMNPWPSAYTQVKSQKSGVKGQYLTLKIIEVERGVLTLNKYKVGEIFLHNGKIAIQCGDDSLIVNKLQLEGKKAMASEEFIKGQRGFVEKILT